VLLLGIYLAQAVLRQLFSSVILPLFY
jgi:hypothetical protein